MPKNSQLHLLLETDLLETLKRDAEKSGISVSELCRQKLREFSQLTKIEIMLEKLDKKISDNTDDVESLTFQG